MTNFKLALLIFGISLVLFSCTNKNSKQYKAVKALEEEVFSMKMLNREKGTELIDAYVNFSKEYPKDTATAGFLFKAGDIAMNMNMGSQAILYYDKVLTLFPDFEKAPESLFLKAFVYENQLGDLEQAEKFYNAFLDKYPKHILAKDAKASLMYLGKSPEELIKLFQQQNQ